MPKLSYADLALLLGQCPPPGSRWRHYKTRAAYVVTGAVIAEATQSPLVVYVTEPYGSSCAFARPLREWQEEVEHEGRRVPRFELLPGC